MPELPEVETVTRALIPVLQGRRIAAVTLRRNDLRLPFPSDFASRLAGRTVVSLNRRAKYILVTLDNDEVLIVHLGMTGRFSVVGPKQADNLGAFYYEGEAGAEGNGPHDHVVFDLEAGPRVVFTDPRRFGMMDLVPAAAMAQHKLLKDLGVEPLGNEFHGAHLALKFRGKAAPLKAALLDQHVVAGLGNIYVSEALHRSRLSPRRKAGTLARRGAPDPRLEHLARHIRDILAEAIRAGGSTLQDFASATGEPGSYQQRFAVYDREGEPCLTPGCGGTIRRIVQSGRSTFYCPRCQK
jgi:formamidopyrimidine-DNA glycosylase